MSCDKIWLLDTCRPQSQWIHIKFQLQLCTRQSLLTLQSLVVSIRTTCFNTLKLYILPTPRICVFRMVLTINSDCFPKQH
jgi:hypothetical protein